LVKAEVAVKVQLRLAISKGFEAVRLPMAA
jgi:hypothetical protein